MFGQRPESAAIERQAPLRHAKKLSRRIAALAFSATALFGGFPASNALTAGEAPTSADAQAAPNPNLNYDELTILILHRRLVEQAQRNQEQANEMKLVLTMIANAQPKIAYDAKLWNDLHQCEQGDSWYADGYNPNDPGHQRFQGGLGMSTVAWGMAVHDAKKRGVELPASALDASIEQQMQGAQVFMEDEGWGWGCHVDGH